MSTSIHSAAIVHPAAIIGDGATIGPYTIVDEHVEIGARTWIGAHNVITGHTRIGDDNRIYHFCSIGEANQDKKYQGEATRLKIGDRNTIREYCSINRGTMQDAGVTRVGSDNWIMAYTHIAHDCQVGDHATIANCTQLAGHVHVGDWATLGGFTGVHQYVKIGAHVMTGVSSVVLLDIPTYVMAGGNPLAPYGINSEGLKRRGFSAEAIVALKRAYKTLYKSGLAFSEAKAELRKQADGFPEVAVLADFLDTATRGIVR
jgi:UDP-N-acetylglucosamine acyltransferase